MKFKNFLLTLILAIFYPLSLLQKVDKKKITFISLENPKLARDFSLINKKLLEEDKYELNYVLFKYENNLLGQLKYIYMSIKQLFNINSSHLVLIDFNNFVISKFKRPEVKVLQVWHATGAIKKFGNSLEHSYKIKNYDYAICNSEIFVKPFSEAFAIPEENVKVTGIPVTDNLFDEEKVIKTRDKLYKELPVLEDKKVITYAPTFRGKLGDGFRQVPIDLDYIQKKLGDDYLIIYKPHPLITNIDIKGNPNILVKAHESIKKIFSVTDILISDYSAVIFDYSIKNSPLLAYAPDLETYKNSPGIYENYEEIFAGRICRTEDDIVSKIKNIDFENYEFKGEFFEKSFKYRDGKSTERVVKLIDQIMEED